VQDSKVRELSLVQESKVRGVNTGAGVMILLNIMAFDEVIYLADTCSK
jgi:hypothetical protein